MSAVPPAFNPQTSFSTLAQQPISSTGLPGSELDGEFARAADSINQIQSRLSEVQRDDGKLRNEVVRFESLSVDVRNVLASSSGTKPVAWSVGAQFAVGDLVSNPPGTPGTYLCATAHTSSSLFSSDLSNWALIAAPPIAGILYTNTFTGDSTTTVFALTEEPASKDNTQVFIDGIYQPKSGYSISGETLTITPAPASGSDIEIIIGAPSTANIVTVTDGAISTSKINNDAVTTPKIANLAVTDTKIANGAISSAKLANSAVSTEKIPNAAITTEKIAQGAVTTDKIAPLAIGPDKITNNSINAIKIADNSISSMKIIDLSVTESKIADGAITPSKIPNGSIAQEKLTRPLTSSAAITASGDTVLFNNIPSWVTQITVAMDGISTTGSIARIRLGTGGSLVATGYFSRWSWVASGNRTDADESANGFAVYTQNTTTPITGAITLSRIGTGNTWVASGCTTSGYDIAGVDVMAFCVGSITLTGALDTVGFVTATGQTFDAGVVSIIYQ